VDVRTVFVRRRTVRPRLAATRPSHSCTAAPLVHQRITYKLCVLMPCVAFRYAPTYLQHAAVPLLTLPGRAHLRSTDTGQYDIPGVSSLASSRAFSVVEPQAWNRLPTSLRNNDGSATFKKNSKTILLKRLITSYFICSSYAFYTLLFSSTVLFSVSGAIEILGLID